MAEERTDEMSTGKIKVCVLTAAMMQMCFVGLAAAIADIAKAFPGQSIQLIQTSVTSINLMSILSALLSGWLASSHSKKGLTLAGLSLVATGGAGGFLYHSSLPLVYLWSVVVGFGMGFFTPPVSSLIVDYFDGDERSRLSGLQTSFVNAGGVILTFGGGLLAAAAWYYSYLAFLVAIPVLLVCLANMPPKNKFTAQTAGKQKMPSPVYYYMVVTFALLLVYNVFGSNVSLFISENKLGGASLAGSVNAVFMIGGVVCGFAFDKLSRRFGEYLFGLSHLLLCGCFLLMCLNASIPVLAAAALIGGSSISLTLPQCIFSVSAKIPPVLSAGVLSLVTIVSPSVATFVSPTVFAYLGRLMSGAGDSRSRYAAAAAVCLVFACALFVSAVIRKRTAAARPR
jgi:MFS family permease